MLRLLFAALVGGWSAVGAEASGEGALAGGPRLVMQAPPALAGVAAQLDRMAPESLAEVTRLVGLRTPGPPILVLLAPEDSAAAREAPFWVSGYADGAAGVIVLLPARSPRYPDSSLADVLRHEVAHVLAARAAAGRPIPRWFDEGVAMIAGGGWSLDDRSRLALALLSSDRIPLSELDRHFGRRGGEAEVAGAYAIAGAFVHDLVTRHGQRLPARVLAGLARGLSFAAAFEAAAGTALPRAEQEFWAGQTLYRWLPLLTSSAALWFAITLLALLAGGRRRRRATALRAVWEAEERARDDSSAGASERDRSDTR